MSDNAIYPTGLELIDQDIEVVGGPGARPGDIRRIDGNVYQLAQWQTANQGQPFAWVKTYTGVEGFPAYIAVGAEYCIGYWDPTFGEGTDPDSYYTDSAYQLVDGDYFWMTVRGPAWFKGTSISRGCAITTHGSDHRTTNAPYIDSTGEYESILGVAYENNGNTVSGYAKGFVHNLRMYFVP